MRRLGVDLNARTAKPSTKRSGAPALNAADIAGAVSRGFRNAMAEPVLTTRQLEQRNYERAFGAYIRRNVISPALERRDMGEASGSIGAYSVPVGFEKAFVDDLRAATALLGHTDIVDTSAFPSPAVPSCTRPLSTPAKVGRDR